MSSDERVERWRRFVYDKHYAAPETFSPSEITHMVTIATGLLVALDAANARAERAEEVAEAAYRFVVVHGGDFDGGQYWDAFNALERALTEQRHGHLRKKALTADENHDEASRNKV